MRKRIRGTPYVAHGPVVLRAPLVGHQEASSWRRARGQIRQHVEPGAHAALDQEGTRRRQNGLVHVGELARGLRQFVARRLQLLDERRGASGQHLLPQFFLLFQARLGPHALLGRARLQRLGNGAAGNRRRKTSTTDL